ncbi:MAG: lytic murein transglycosylase [Alphaproteobacteria bacterium]|nr:lytic murein transglycosylase [Alphaproteobacteria bacterium]
MRQYLTALLVSACCALGAAGVALGDTPPGIVMSSPVPDTQDRPPAFVAWIAAFRAEALAQGISAKTFDNAFRGVKLNQRVVELNENQPEFNRAIWDYLDSALSEDRVKHGKHLMRRHRRLLRVSHREYGVPPSIITAIWAMESNYGKLTGGFNVIEALATLAYQGRRAAFGHEQLLAALKIIEEGDIAPERMTGSWAGAMGQTQFIPTVYLQYARDGNGDGKRNLWDTLSDVFASTANYLQQKGWIEGKPCFDEVRLPAKFNFGEADLSIEKPVREWKDEGVVRVDGRRLPRSVMDLDAALIVPAGHSGPAFLTYPNFKAILAYNNAISYALAVCQLSKRFDGGRPFRAPWPRNDIPLAARADRMELQALLARRNFDVGEPDGVIGRRTRQAIRDFQKTEGLIEDGYASMELLVRLRQSRVSSPTP